MHQTGCINWYSKISSLLDQLNISANIQNELKNDKHTVNNIKNTLYTNEMERIMKEINQSDKEPKLRTYKILKTDYRLEPYLITNTNKKIVSKIAQFRTSSHNLRIELGRHERPRLPPEQRICLNCDLGEIEDEIHHLLKCLKYTKIRSKLICTIEKYVNDFSTKSIQEKFKIIMESREYEIVKTLGIFLLNAS
jgi:hypothetical protein